MTPLVCVQYILLILLFLFCRNVLLEVSHVQRHLYVQSNFHDNHITIIIAHVRNLINFFKLSKIAVLKYF